jgi:hypothetical protein
VGEALANTIGCRTFVLPITSTNENALLMISDGPRFRSRPQSVQADQGSTVTLTCDVDGNPPPDIVWVHQATDRVNKSLFY